MAMMAQDFLKVQLLVGRWARRRDLSLCLALDILIHAAICYLHIVGCLRPHTMCFLKIFFLVLKVVV